MRNRLSVLEYSGCPVGCRSGYFDEPIREDSPPASSNDLLRTGEADIYDRLRNV